ncbi:hypothetical protein AGMMS50268_28220 [Spirochaetia bacterium]|nr:hypothetical protein AGMMS50268_28220 [Spirochaetia bacterium]
MPFDVVSPIAKKPDNLSYLQELVEEGIAVFRRAFFENKDA